MRKTYATDEMKKNEMLKTLTKSEPRYNAFERDIVVLNIFFGKSTAIEYEKSRRMTETDFLSNLGGLFGLCLGFSIISFIEIVYWFIIRMFKKRNVLFK